MKKKKMFFRAVSVLLLLATVLSSCAKWNTGSDDTVNTDAEQNIDLSDYILISDDNYKLIRPDDANDNVMDIFKLLHGELTSLLGAIFPTDNDWVNRGESVPQNNKEILLGLTNRDDSKNVFDSLGEKEYKICITEDHVVIVGKDDLALYYAVNEFLDEAVIDMNGKLYVPKALNVSNTYSLLDNSSLIPQIKPDSEVQLLASSSDGTTMTPDWVNDLIIVEANIKNVSGTLEKAKTQIVDHLAQMGVNVLSPVFLLLSPLLPKSK